MVWCRVLCYGVVYYVMLCSSTRILLRMKVWLTIEWCETILTYKPLNLSSEKGSGKLLPLSLLESKKHHDPASLVSSLLFSQASYQVCCFLLYSSMMLPGTYLNPGSHELVLVLMIPTSSLISQQKHTVWASHNRVPCP